MNRIDYQSLFQRLGQRYRALPPAARFLLHLAGLYLFWKFIFVPYLVTPFPVIQDFMWRNQYLFLGLAYPAVGVLMLFGYDARAVVEQKLIVIEEAQSVLVGGPCLGLELFIGFGALIVAFPAPLRHKLWYVPAGLVGIYLLNLFRIVVLTGLVHEAPAYVDFNHKYLFYGLVYGLIFLMWLVFVRRYAPAGTSGPARSEGAFRV